ncbi:MAG: 30S ribosomal protein S17 [Phycisphaerae bacterium]|nr:30S ribosomal protein S17 [Phycisphaerae bacterium]
MSDVDQGETVEQIATTKRTLRRLRIGVVESDVRDKTIKVRIDRLMRHPKYGKYLKRRSMLHAHDEKNEACNGDVVEIMECRPISKTKSWRLSRIIRRFAKS